MTYREMVASWAFIALSAALWVATLLALGSCAPPRTEADIAGCYATVDAAMQPRVLTECRGHEWASCPAHDSIMVEWASRAKECER